MKIYCKTLAKIATFSLGFCARLVNMICDFWNPYNLQNHFDLPWKGAKPALTFRFDLFTLTLKVPACFQANLIACGDFHANFGHFRLTPNTQVDFFVIGILVEGFCEGKNLNWWTLLHNIKDTWHFAGDFHTRPRNAKEQTQLWQLTRN